MITLIGVDIGIGPASKDGDLHCETEFNFVDGKIHLVEVRYRIKQPDGSLRPASLQEIINKPRIFTLKE